MHSTRKNGLITQGMQQVLEAESAIGDEVRGVVEDILMAKSSAVKSPRQQLALIRLLRSLMSAKASPSVDTRDEASDEVVADAVKATPPLAGKKPTPKRKKSTPKNLDAIADATVVDACTNDIMDAMEVDASRDVATDGNIIDGETKSIVHAFIDAILDAVEAMDAIADATVVDACTNDIVDAMEVDPSIDAATDGNVNDGGIESIVRVVIDVILDAVEAMGTDATIEDTRGMVEEVLIEREAGTHEAMGTSDGTAQAEVVFPSDATVEDTRGKGEEVLIGREAGTREAVGASDVTVQAEVVCPSDAADDIVDAKEAKGTNAAVIEEAMGEAVMVATNMTNMKEENAHNTTEARIEQNNEAGKGTEVQTDRAAQSTEAMGEDTNEAGTKNANKEAKKGHESARQERLKCLVVMPIQIVALPPASCEEKKRRDNLCIILDVNGLLIRRYKVSFYKGIARSNTLDWA
ncbi:hypothetical protein L7F22_004196 [Adiantum nelumboides]|nr:hypothetical protein [Adiantum nelumboides]